MPALTQTTMEAYLASVFGKRVTVLRITPLGEVFQENSIKSYGYGKPIRVDYQTVDGQPQSAVFHTASPNPFGHEHMSDRAQMLLWSHQAFNHLPRHARSLDVGAFQSNGNLLSLGTLEEFCQLTEYVEGKAYNLDLERLRDSNSIRDLDIARADALCDYLVQIHGVRGADGGLYTRRIRELVGHGECIMGLTDSYPPHHLIDAVTLEEIEHLCVKWRWKLKSQKHRLRQIHGDFHPWNILFSDGTDFRVLDRSRGEFGDPADDVACITSNFLFFSLQRYECLDGVLHTLFQRFWERYLAGSGDFEVLRVVAPFFAFRGLVMASPVWYPALPASVRQKLLAFVLSVLREDEFNPQEVNDYCSGKPSSFRVVGDRPPCLW